MSSCLSFYLQIAFLPLFSTLTLPSPLPSPLPSFDKELSNLKANMSRATAAKESMSLQASIVSHSQRMMRLERILEGDG